MREIVAMLYGEWLANCGGRSGMEVSPVGLRAMPGWWPNGRTRTGTLPETAATAFARQVRSRHSVIRQTHDHASRPD